MRGKIYPFFNWKSVEVGDGDGVLMMVGGNEEEADQALEILKFSLEIHVFSDRRGQLWLSDAYIMIKHRGCRVKNDPTDVDMCEQRNVRAIDIEWVVLVKGPNYDNF